MVDGCRVGRGMEFWFEQVPFWSGNFVRLWLVHTISCVASRVEMMLREDPFL